MTRKISKPDLIYPELSYKIVGILFDIFSSLGYGFGEKQYQKAIEIALKNLNIKYKKELPIKIFYKDNFLTNNYADFLIDNKIILEIKKGNFFNKKDIEQVFNYLKVYNVKLGILARFTRSGVKFKRIINIK